MVNFKLPGVQNLRKKCNGNHLVVLVSIASASMLVWSFLAFCSKPHRAGRKHFIMAFLLLFVRFRLLHIQHSYTSLALRLSYSESIPSSFQLHKHKCLHVRPFSLHEIDTACVCGLYQSHPVWK